MEQGTQQLKAYYESQTTEVLLGIAKADLTDEARLTLTEVLSNRGIKPEIVETAKEEGVSERSSGLRLALRWDRFFAFALDIFGATLVAAIFSLPLYGSDPGQHSKVFSLVWFTYFLFRDGIPGVSLGKRLLGMRVVDEKTGKPCTLLQSLGRNFLHATFGIDAIFALGTRRKRLGDSLVGTLVINRRGTQTGI